MTASSPIDRTVLTELQETAGADFVAELVQEFFDQAPQMLAQMRAALASAAADDFRRAAHSLKSNSMTFGATELGSQARALELGGLPADASALDALQASYERAAAELKGLVHG